MKDALIDVLARKSDSVKGSVAKHTPGPWGFVYDGSSTWSIGREFDPQDSPPFVSIMDPVDERAKANAALIAAAPDLLAALSRMLNELPERRDWLDPVTEKIARAACAKAYRP